MTITRGDTHNFKVTVKDSDGNIFDLSGYSMLFTAKDDATKSDVEAAIQKTATISSPTSGIGEFNLLPADTSIAPGDYFYDVQISDGTNNVYTVIKTAKLTILNDITKNT